MVVPNNENALHWADYVVFAGFLATSTGIGIFFGWKAKKNAALVSIPFYEFLILAIGLDRSNEPNCPQH